MFISLFLGLGGPFIEFGIGIALMLLTIPLTFAFLGARFVKGGFVALLSPSLGGFKQRLPVAGYQFTQAAIGFGVAALIVFSLIHAKEIFACVHAVL